MWSETGLPGKATTAARFVARRVHTTVNVAARGVVAVGCAPAGAPEVETCARSTSGLLPNHVLPAKALRPFSRRRGCDRRVRAPVAPLRRGGSRARHGGACWWLQFWRARGGGPRARGCGDAGRRI